MIMQVIVSSFQHIKEKKKSLTKRMLYLKHIMQDIWIVFKMKQVGEESITVTRIFWKSSNNDFFIHSEDTSTVLRSNFQ